MLSLRDGRAYASRGPVDLSHPKTTRRSPVRLLTVSNGRPVAAAAAAAVRCRVDSDDSPPSVVGRSGVRHWSSSSSSSMGSILKTSDLHRHQRVDGEGGARVGASRRPRKVRFTDDVSLLHRFDSGGGDSEYSSTESDPRLYPAYAAAGRSGLPGGRHPKATTVSVPGSDSRWNNNNNNNNNNTVTIYDDDRYDRLQSSVARRQIPSDRQRFPVYPLGIKQPSVVHGHRPNVNLDKTRSTPSLHWPSGASPPPPFHRQEPSVVGLSSSSSSGALKTANHIVVGDPVTRKTKLIVAAKLCGSFRPSDVIVKANKDGDRLRITSTTSHQHRGDTPGWRHEGLNEHLLLPVRVHPNRLTARIDPNGDLIIEAPCAL